MNTKLTPQWAWRLSRLNVLNSAISSRKGYDVDGEFIKSPIPEEWFLEYAEHFRWLAKNQPEQLITFIQ